MPLPSVSLCVTSIIVSGIWFYESSYQGTLRRECSLSQNHRRSLILQWNVFNIKSYLVPTLVTKRYYDISQIPWLFTIQCAFAPLHRHRAARWARESSPAQALYFCPLTQVQLVTYCFCKPGINETKFWRFRNEKREFELLPVFFKFSLHHCVLFFYVI